MTDTQNQRLDAEAGSSFQGQVYLLNAGREIPLRLSRLSDKFSWGITPEDDWLQAGGNEAPPVFDFVLHSQTANRLHFNISGTGRNAAKKLGISRNGYLGLYERSEVSDYWKLEPLAWTEQGLVCRWRDHQGHQVKALPDTPHRQPGTFLLLNVSDGDVHEFLIRRVD